MSVRFELDEDNEGVVDDRESQQKEEAEAEDGEKKTKKKRKERSDKNKKRKHEHRNDPYSIIIDQNLLLVDPIDNLVENIESIDASNIHEYMPTPPQFNGK